METKIVSHLIKKGVNIPNPESVFISGEVDPDRISAENVTIHAGSKIYGERTLILADSVIGYEAPVTIDNSQLGKNTHLKGGYFKGAVFAGGNVFGSGAHVREGTILEEEANAAHTVGLKQTILFPFVTLGSLINFCDCFMAGGTSRKDHSEVGSSFIHFNYTPNQDKATPSMMGDVHQGVMLDKKPVFLGGQGGLVGPVRIGYGCISAAGSILRKNEEREERLLLGGGFKNASVPRKFHTYTNIELIFKNNVLYISALIALKAWYRNIRSLFTGPDAMNTALHEAMKYNLDLCIKERIKRFIDFGEKLKLSKEILISGKMDKNSKSALVHDTAIRKIEDSKQIFDQAFADDSVTSEGDTFIQTAEKSLAGQNMTYIDFVKQMPPETKASGSRWLNRIETRVAEQLIFKQD